MGDGSNTLSLFHWASNPPYAANNSKFLGFGTVGQQCSVKVPARFYIRRQKQLPTTAVTVIETLEAWTSCTLLLCVTRLQRNTFHTCSIRYVSQGHDGEGSSGCDRKFVRVSADEIDKCLLVCCMNWAPQESTLKAVVQFRRQPRLHPCFIWSSALQIGGCLSFFDPVVCKCEVPNYQQHQGRPHAREGK